MAAADCPEIEQDSTDIDDEGSNSQPGNFHDDVNMTKTFREGISELLSRKTGRSSCDFEKEHVMTAEFREGVQVTLSHMFHYLRYSVFRRKYLSKVKDEKLLIKLHSDFTLRLEEAIVKLVTEVLNDTDVIVKLNELSELIEKTPLTFTNVWRPSGDPEKDVEAHLAPIHDKFYKIFTGMHQEQQRENASKQAEISKLEVEILSMKTNMSSLADKLEEQAEKEYKTYLETADTLRKQVGCSD